MTGKKVSELKVLHREREPSKAVVEVLEKALAYAKAGKMKGVVIIGISDDVDGFGGSFHAFDHHTNIPALIGELEITKQRMVMEEIDSMGESEPVEDP